MLTEVPDLPDRDEPTRTRPSASLIDQIVRERARRMLVTGIPSR